VEQSNKIKVGLAAGLFVLAAALYFWMSSGREDAPLDGESTTYWYCTEAKKSFTLTPQEAGDSVRMMRRVLTGDEDSPTARRSRAINVAMALSPYTNQYTGVEAVKCPKCGEIFEARDEQGDPRLCPACGADPMADEPAPEDNSTSPDNG
jgi:hypothetical protein